MFGIKLKRKSEQKPARKKRGYHAGKTNQFLSDWLTGLTNINEDIKSAHTTLLARSRDLSQNNAFFKRYLHLRKMFVVGETGMRLAANIGSFIKGKFHPDKTANDIIERAWREWSRPENCTIHKNLSIVDVQELAEDTEATDGTFFVRKVTGKAAGNKFNFALQLIDTALLNTSLNRAATGTHNPIHMGIEFNADTGRVINYYFKTADHKQTGKNNVIPASEIYCKYNQQQVGQLLGVPACTQVMTNIHMYEGYNEAAVMNARAAACKMGFIELPEGEDEIDVDDFTAGALRPLDIQVLPQGAKFSSFDPKQPTSEHATFTKTQLREIANGLGVSYNSLANDLESVNYSSLRVGHKTEQATWRGCQRRLAQQLLTPIYNDFIENAILAGAVNLKISKLERYKNIAFHGQTFYDVDPLKDNNGRLALLATGLNSELKICAELGIDYEELQQERQRAAEIRKQYGTEPDAEALRLGLLAAFNPVPVDE